MKIEIVTAHEAERLGLTHSKLFREGHGAFGEPDNSYIDVVYIGGKEERLFDGDLIIFKVEPPNREVIQVISRYYCSDKMLEIFNQKALEKRKKDRYDEYIKLKKEIEADDFYNKRLLNV